MDHYNWTSIPEEKLSPSLTRRVIHTEHMTIARLVVKQGGVVPLHQHINEQVTMMMAGSLRFELGESDPEVVIVRAGEALRIPPNLPHRVEALEDSEATDLFSPRREDWISGDDSYLRR